LSKSYQGPKFIVVSGGVMSGVGKGLATASIGKILQQYGYKTTAIKIDPYINYDAGTLRPTEHGEVWVTDDGGEIDQDLGNYERFLGINLSRSNNLTTGQIYQIVIERERRGEYLGKTVQPIPHVTDEIKRRIGQCAEGYEMVLVEIGGTVGDYENEIFLYALKSIERDIGKANMVYVLVTYLPILRHLGEMKTKPTQQAIRLLGENGIFPDFILCRGTQPLDEIRKRKIEVSANIGADYIISNPDVQTLYSIPLDLEEEGMGEKLLDKLGLKSKRSPDWTHWKKLVHTIEHPKRTVKIAMVGKYVESGDFSFSDSYISINQSLEHAGAALGVQVAISWIDAKGLEQDASEASLEPRKVEQLSEYDGILIPGAFGDTGAEGMLRAVRTAREHHVPFLGLCYGLHMAVVEFARNMCGMEGANSTEIDPKSNYPVIDFQPEQRERIERKEYGGTMRLGAYTAILKEGSQVLELYKRAGRLKEDARRIAELKKAPERASHLGLLPPEGNFVLERHRHRYEVAPEFVETLERKGLVFSGYHLTNRGSKLMEFLELPGHPYFIATQAHPEFKSRLEKPAPLFYGFIEAALRQMDRKS